MPQNYHSARGDQVLPNLYLLASVSTGKVWQSLLSGTPIIAAGYINLVATQAKRVDKTKFRLHKGIQLWWNRKLAHDFSFGVEIPG